MSGQQQNKETKQSSRQGKQLSPTARMAGIAVGLFLVVALLVFAGVKIYEAATYVPFTDEVIPSTLTDSERAAAVARTIED